MTQRKSHNLNNEPERQEDGYVWRHELSDERVKTAADRGFLEEPYDPEAEYRKRMEQRKQEENRKRTDNKASSVRSANPPAGRASAQAGSSSQRRTSAQAGAERRAPAQGGSSQRRATAQTGAERRAPAQGGSGQRRASAQAGAERRAPAQGGSGQRRASAQAGAERRTPAQAGGSQRRTSAQTGAERRVPAQGGSGQRRTSAQAGAERRTQTSSQTGTERRRTESGRTGKKSGSGKVLSSGFLKGFFIVWGIIAVLIVVLLIVLSSFLKRYENGLPEHEMDLILSGIEEGDLSALHLVTEDGLSIDDPSMLADPESIASFLQKKSEEDELRYVKVNSESSDSTNIYSIRSGDEKLLKVFLERDGSGEQSWREQKTQLTAEKLKVSEITVQIPSANSLSVNGTQIDSSFITESGARIRILENLMDLGFIGPQPTVDTYKIRGIFASPSVVTTDPSGVQEDCSLIEDVYVAGFEADPEFENAQRARVLSLFDQYARYFSGDAGPGALSAVMLDNSPAYINAAAADVSWMQAHDGVVLSEESVENIKKYSDSCYSCDIHFKEDILQGGVSARTWDTNMTWIMVLDGDYYIADLITKTAED